MGGNNEDPITTCLSRIGNELCFANLCATNKYARSTTTRADACVRKKYDQLWNNNDAAAFAALFTNEAIEVTNTGPIYGREALEKNWTELFQKVHFSNHVTTVDQYSPHVIGTSGNELWMNGVYSMTLKGENFGPVKQKGYWCLILVRDGDAWKTRLQIWNIAQPPPAPAQTK